MSKLIINVGGTGTGKTTETKKIIKEVKIPLFLFDVNNEYNDFKNQNYNHFDFKKFLNDAKYKSNTAIIFEEATIFLSHHSSEEIIRNICVRKRHTKNLLIFNFHSLRQVPLFLLDFCDLMIIRKTKDLPINVMDKFKHNPNILNAFNSCLQNTNKYHCEFVFDIN